MSQTRPKFLRSSLRPITTWNNHTSNSFSMSWLHSRLINSLKANLTVYVIWVRPVRTLSFRARSAISFGVSLFKPIIIKKTSLRTVLQSTLKLLNPGIWDKNSSFSHNWLNNLKGQVLWFLWSGCWLNWSKTRKGSKLTDRMYRQRLVTSRYNPTRIPLLMARLSRVTAMVLRCLPLLHPSKHERN